MKTKYLAPVLGMAVWGATAHAGLYRMTFSGELDSVVDTRSVGNDPYAGTVWAVDNYVAQVGDLWEYTITYNTDTIPNDIGPGFAIYGLFSPASMSLNGNVIELRKNTQLYFIDSEVEIFGEAPDIADQNSFVRTWFVRTDGVNELINGGELFTDAGIFADLEWRGFQIGANTSLFNLQTDGQSPYKVTVDQIPSSSTLLVLGGAGLLSARRRR